MEEREIIMGIYCIRNLVNSKVYVGQSIDIEYRIHTHQLLSDKDVKNSHLYNAIKKYGKENFEVEILERTDDRTKLNELEYKWMAELKACNRETGYNTREDNGTTYVMSQETKDRLSKSLTGVPKSEEHKANMPTKYKEGYKIDEETLKKRNAAIKLAWEEGRHTGNTLSNSGSFQKGHIPANIGKLFSDETKEKMRQRKLGTKQSAETIAARIESIGYNRIYQFNLSIILVAIYDTVWDVVHTSNGKYLQPGIHGCCNGSKGYYKDSIFKYEKDIELVETKNGTSFKYKEGINIKPIIKKEKLKKVNEEFDNIFVSKYNADGTIKENFGKDIV
jgi:group I intron endonuclease